MMKKTILTAALSLGLVAGSIMAQSPADRHEPRGGQKERGHEMKNPIDRMSEALDLTDAQQSQIKAIHLEMAKKNQPLQNKINELDARMNTLTTSDMPDSKEIKKVADQISSLKGEVFINMTMSKVKVRSLLDDEQKMKFDRMQQHKDRNKGQHKS
ncbi:Spy/CpxP family protein refolding chaperone [Reichenbachiella agarivorans]|uniref:Spy/CpxP family protein refolding chaperone n=1 Tax=Reichenbachiella agarivorans TaxID=2979464 RepID=A0ABY6CVB8_9BACT|nr:Spy/CpxP family protein refolding chaperone [Reichenbachiella agarivorans]UXP33955.1 Spy/CpxP family protein refolding chaperone [Reichenbachiella agarivorans]